MENRIDVFLSRKSEDAHLAKEIYDILTAKGLNVFDAEQSLAQMGNADYSEAIDEALEKTTHLIVVGSSAENISSEWIKAEWRFFLNRKRAGKKKGNILTIITKEMEIDDLPSSLQNFEVIPFEKSLDKIWYYVGRNKHFIPEDIKDEGVPLSRSKPISGQEDFEKGRALYKDKKYGEAYYFLQRSAEYGNPSAQNLVGAMWEEGKWLDQDYTKAMDWYLKASNQGLAEAQNRIGCLYSGGHGVNQDHKAAMQWFLKAAEAGNVAAQNNIGALYDFGQGVIQDYKTAMQWYLKAAEQGDAVAQRNIGILYEFGLGVTQDYRTAIQWNLKAAEQGDAKAQYNIGNISYWKSNKVNGNPDEAIQWLMKAAEHGYAPAQEELEYIHEVLVDTGAEEDHRTVLKWYLEATAQGGVDAQYKMGDLYKHGLYGVPTNNTTALRWYLKAAEQEHADAQYAVGQAYHYGSGVQANREIARPWFVKAAKRGQKDAISTLKQDYSSFDY